MAVYAQPVPQPVERLRQAEGGAIARLKLLHAEAEETARLANLLGRSLYAGIALPVLGILAVGLADGISPVWQLVWCGFVASISLALLVAYRHAMRQPFERATLRQFAKDLSAILLFAGFVWGAGAFLALPPGTSAIPAVLFAAAPSVAIAILLREREALFLFLAPVVALTAFASILRPFADGMLDGGLIVAVCAAIAAGSMLAERRGSKPAMLSLP